MLACRALRDVASTCTKHNNLSTPPSRGLQSKTGLTRMTSLGFNRTNGVRKRGYQVNYRVITTIGCMIDSRYLAVKPPRDLRLTRRPMHTQLAASHAGATKDDVADFLALRDHWLETRPRAQLLASAEHTPLRCVAVSSPYCPNLSPDCVASVSGLSM